MMKLNGYTTTFCVFALLYVLLNRTVISVFRCSWSETKKQSKYGSISLDAELTPSEDRLLVTMCSDESVDVVYSDITERLCIWCTRI
jgi:hypothetical protein